MNDRDSRRAIAARLLAAALGAMPTAALSADLVVWWEQGFYEQEDEAVDEIVAAFEQETGKDVALVRHSQDDILAEAKAAMAAGQPIDFLWSTTSERDLSRWAEAGQLADLEKALEPVIGLFDEDAIEAGHLYNSKTGERHLYGMPMARSSNHVHVWRSLLKSAGFTREEIPKDWSAFWAFWCDEVQPEVRAALGRDDVWAVGLPMSTTATADTQDELLQFQLAYGAPWVGVDGRMGLDDPALRQARIDALRAFTDLWRKGCVPPDATSWTNYGNNEAFLTQRVAMTVNTTLSIPGELRTFREDDYYDDAATIDWPAGIDGEPLVIYGGISFAATFDTANDPALRERFVRFLAEDGWLAHWLTFAGDRYLPPMRKLIEQPFWLDTGDPHRLRSAIQMLTQQHHDPSAARDPALRAGDIYDANVWGKAVERVVVDGLTPEAAVDEAIARIKAILGE